MDVSHAEPGAGQRIYIRANAASDVDPRRVLWLVGWFCVAVLAGITVATAIGASHQNALQRKLQHDGVPVVATVTGCAGVTSGVGQAVVYYNCTASYQLDGHRHSTVLGGNRGLHPVGQRLRAVALRRESGVLATATSVAKSFSPWTPYVTPLVLGVATILLALSMILWPRRQRRRHAPTDAGTAPSAIA